MLNRVNAPKYNSLFLNDFIAIENLKLDNGVEVNFLRGGIKDVSKIDFVFPAGTSQAKKTLLASTTGNLLIEGTKNKSSLEIANILDSYGAYFSVSSFFHSSVVTLFTLSKHLTTLIPLVKELIYDASFPSDEFEIYIDKKRQEFLINSEKVRNLSTRKLKEVIFGSQHTYGQSVNIEDFDTISKKDVEKFHKEYYLKNNLEIIVSGQPDNNIFKILNENFGLDERILKAEVAVTDSFTSSKEKIHFVEKSDSLQSAIKIGRPIFNNLHPDFISLTIVNTILGGYFGSRLMKVVREEKGLTYGIGSGLQSYKHSGLWIIATEVAFERQNEALEAVFVEMERLRNEKISDDELEIVKNFMLGELIRRFDGPYSSADIFRTLKENSLDFSYYKRLEKTIKNILPKDILELSQKYLQKDDFFVIIAGLK